jgi:hypothetical protein
MKWISCNVETHLPTEASECMAYLYVSHIRHLLVSVSQIHTIQVMMTRMMSFVNKRTKNSGLGNWRPLGPGGCKREAFEHCSSEQAINRWGSMMFGLDVILRQAAYIVNSDRRSSTPDNRRADQAGATEQSNSSSRSVILAKSRSRSERIQSTVATVRPPRAAGR